MTIPQGRVRRTAPLAALSARAAGGGVVDVLRRRLKGERGTSLEFHIRNAERYADVLSRSKGVLMKVGQIMSFVDTSAVLDGPYDEITERFGEELDYRTELANQMEFAEHYRGHPFARVPEVFPELSSHRVLTMELVHGRRWTEIGDVDQELRDRWGEAINRFFFGSIARFGMFNADPHPGNYLFDDDGTVTFLDFGCVKRMTAAVQRGFFDFHAAAMDNDAERLLEVWIEHGFTRAESPPPADKVLAWCRQNFAAFHQPQPFTFTPEFVSGLLGHMASMDTDVMRHSTVPRD